MKDQQVQVTQIGHGALNSGHRSPVRHNYMMLEPTTNTRTEKAAHST